MHILLLEMLACVLPRQRCRWVFQEILAGALPTDTVQFNKQLVGISESAMGDEVICRFADGDEAAFDLVVGCDGVKSKVAPLLPPLSTTRARSSVSTAMTVTRVITVMSAARCGKRWWACKLQSTQVMLSLLPYMHLFIQW